MNIDKIKWLNNDFFFSGECKWISDKYQNIVIIDLKLLKLKVKVGLFFLLKVTIYNNSTIYLSVWYIKFYYYKFI